MLNPSYRMLTSACLHVSLFVRSFGRRKDSKRWPLVNFHSLVNPLINPFQTMVNRSHGWSMCPTFKLSHHCRSTFPTTGQLYSLLWANYSRYAHCSTSTTAGQSVPTFSNVETIFGTLGQPIQRMVNLSQRVINSSNFVSIFLTLGQSSQTGWSTRTLIKSSLSSTCPTVCQLF